MNKTLPHQTTASLFGFLAKTPRERLRCHLNQAAESNPLDQIGQTLAMSSAFRSGCVMTGVISRRIISRNTSGMVGGNVRLRELHHQVTFAVDGESRPIVFAIADVIEVKR